MRVERVAVDLCQSGTGQVAEDKLEAAADDAAHAAWRPRAHQARPADLRASYGRFGRKPDADGGFSWENTDLVDVLKGHFS